MAESVPPREPGPELRDIFVLEVSPVMAKPKGFSRVTVTAGEIGEPVGVEVGCWVKTRWGALSSKTVPSPRLLKLKELLPPSWQVPNKSPLESMQSVSAQRPLTPLKEASVVMELAPLASSKTVPQRVDPEEIAGSVTPKRFPAPSITREVGY